MSKIYPDKEDCDEEQEKARFVHAKRICKKRHLAEEVNVASSAEEEGDCSLVKVRLTLHSDMKEDLKSRVKQKERTLETVASATVGHVKEYVRVRLGIELGLQSKAGKENSQTNVPNTAGQLNNIKIFKLDTKDALIKLDEHKSLSSLSEEKEEGGLLNLIFNCDLETTKPC